MGKINSYDIYKIILVSRYNYVLFSEIEKTKHMYSIFVSHKNIKLC